MALTYNLDTQFKREAENLDHLKRMRSGFSQSQKQSPISTLLLIVVSCTPLLFYEQASKVMSDFGLTRKGGAQVAVLSQNELGGLHAKKSAHGAKRHGRKHGK